MEKGMAYVMLGRCENLNDIYIAGDFNKEGINCSPGSLEESEALKKRFIEKQDTKKRNRLAEVKISYLNIMRLFATNHDNMLDDDELMDSDMIGLGETWLQPEEERSFEGFQSEFASSGNGKGVAALLKNAIHYSCRKVSTSLMSLIFLTTTELKVVFMYLSQGFDKEEVLRLLDECMDGEEAIAIMGDVNWDYFGKPDHKMKDFMASKGFSQLIQEATHEKGKTLDHIYVNQILKQRGCYASQQSVHYSDHDIVSLHVPNAKK